MERSIPPHNPLAFLLDIPLAESSSLSSDGKAEDHDPNELEWEASLRRHMGTFTTFDSIVSTQRVQWAKGNLAEEINAHGSKRAKFEEDREKWGKEKEVMKAHHLSELRKEIVRAWMRIEEQDWEKRREEWKEEASTLEREFKDELRQFQAIASKPVIIPFGQPAWAFYRRPGTY